MSPALLLVRATDTPPFPQLCCGNGLSKPLHRKGFFYGFRNPRKDVLTASKSFRLIRPSWRFRRRASRLLSCDNNIRCCACLTSRPFTGRIFRSATNRLGIFAFSFVVTGTPQNRCLPNFRTTRTGRSNRVCLPSVSNPTLTPVEHHQISPSRKVARFDRSFTCFFVLCHAAKSFT